MQRGPDSTAASFAPGIVQAKHLLTDAAVLLSVASTEYAPGGTSFLVASRSWDWIDYDRVALAGAFSNSTQADAQLVGQQLRNYWLNYSGVTRLRASVGRNLFRGLSFTLSGENLLNRQHGEPDNITVVPGRTVSFGLRAVM